MLLNATVTSRALASASSVRDCATRGALSSGSGGVQVRLEGRDGSPVAPHAEQRLREVEARARPRRDRQRALERVVRLRPPLLVREPTPCSNKAPRLPRRALVDRLGRPL